MTTPEQLVQHHVFALVSSLVSTLAAGAYLDIKIAGHDHGAETELLNLFAQAAELAAPIDDWEEPLIQAGWKRVGIGDGLVADWRWQHQEDIGPGEPDAQTACEEAGIEPYQREVFEFWIVSDWLADKLEAHGEKVDRDFAGLIVWARTTTGQAIYADGLFEEIAREVSL